MLDAKAANARAQALVHAFEPSRQDVLGGLYSKIESRFIDLYRGLHGPDEGSFSAAIALDGEMQVDFHDQGGHPPLALHSEGHQDSVGLCLYLALAERLGGNTIGLTMLDDVVMSIDSGHRRNLAKLLGEAFPNRQFLITTHDRTWARQLRAVGVIPGKNVTEFESWDIESGPANVSGAVAWDVIHQHLERNEISSAAHILRHYLEGFFTEVCESLQAKVVMRSDGRWTLGDVLPPAIAKYRRFLRRGSGAYAAHPSAQVLW